MTADAMTHFGDPCIHCGIGHDDIPIGPCQGDPAKAIPIAHACLGVRWDHVEHNRIRLSNGRIIDRWNHISEHAPYWHWGFSETFQHPPPYDERLKHERPSS